jgi:5-methylthioadenosine/S-adenosylhomocysteine deaminase
MSKRVVLDRIDLVVTVDTEHSVIEGAAIAIEDGRIAEIGPSGSLTGDERIDLSGHLVAPGLINTHTHLAMTLLRGWAEGVDLQGFLERVWAAEGAIMDPQTCELGTELGALEALLGGTTTTLDMYLHPESTHRGAVRVGLRHLCGPIFFDFPGLDAMQWHERIEFARNWPERVADIGGPEVPLYLMPHSTYTDSPEHLGEVTQVAEEINASIHLHVSETLAENEDVATRYQKSPVEVLQSSGMLSRHVVYGHGVHLSDHDLELTKGAGAAIAHCPGSNMKLGSGLIDLSRLHDAGVTVGLGTDGCSSSNDLDMWQAMRMAAHVQAITSSPARVSAAKIFAAATREAAQALMIDHLVGSIEIGKRADLIALDLNKPHLTPIHDVYALLVFAAGRGDVTDVWVDGERVVEDSRATRVDAGEIITRARQRAQSLKALR